MANIETRINHGSQSVVVKSISRALNQADGDGENMLGLPGTSDTLMG